MTEQKTEFEIPRQSIKYLVLCLTGVLIFIFLGIVPDYISLARLDKEISRLQFKREEQQTLRPVYESINNSLQIKDERSLPLPERDKLAKEEIERVFRLFKDTAERSGMETVSIVPELNALSNNSGMLPVNVMLKGGYFNFRKLLIGLGAIPYIENIEDIGIQHTVHGKEFKVKALIAVKY